MASTPIFLSARSLRNRLFPLSVLNHPLARSGIQSFKSAYKPFPRWSGWEFLLTFCWHMDILHLRWLDSRGGYQGYKLNFNYVPASVCHPNLPVSPHRLARLFGCQCSEFLHRFDMESTMFALHQCLLPFAMGHLHYQLVTLLSRLSSVPWMFTKFLAPVLVLLCSPGIFILRYLDYLLLKEPSHPVQSKTSLCHFASFLNHNRRKLIGTFPLLTVL